MAYQRTEYADKTLSMNSLADRKLRIQLGSIDSHKETIEKEMKRERKKLERELGGKDDHLRTRLDIGDRSPRLSRRYSTPPELLSATLPSSITDPKRSPLPTRRRIGSETLSDSLNNSPGNTPTSLSPTSMFLKAPFDQPRRQSLPPICDGGLLSAESSARRDRRGSHGGGIRTGPLLPSPSTSGTSTPRSLSRKGSSLNEHEMSEVTAKVSRFLQKIDNKEQTDDKKKSENKNACEKNTNEEEFDRCQHEVLQQTTNKNQGVFHPLNFE